MKSPILLRPIGGSNASLSASFLRKSWVSPSHVGSHRVHSVVASSTKEKKLVGDVHAVSFAASLPSHREMLLKALWSLLSQPGFFRRYVGVPVNETHLEHAREMWRHCRHRHVFMVCGRLHLDSHESAVESAAAQRCLDLQDKFLSMWNGDLRSHRPYHICSVLSDGRLCCDSEEEVRAKFFAVGVEAGVLLDASDSPPSINRWGHLHSGSVACGRCLLFSQRIGAKCSCSFSQVGVGSCRRRSA